MRPKQYPKCKFFYLEPVKPEFGEIDVSEVFVYFENGNPNYYEITRKLLIVQALNFKIASGKLISLYLQLKNKNITNN